MSYRAPRATPMAPTASRMAWTGRRFCFTGQVVLPDVQLYHSKARVYDAVLGHFLQTDPYGLSCRASCRRYALAPAGAEAALRRVVAEPVKQPRFKHALRQRLAGPKRHVIGRRLPNAVRRMAGKKHPREARALAIFLHAGFEVLFACLRLDLHKSALSRQRLHRHEIGVSLRPAQAIHAPPAALRKNKINQNLKIVRIKFGQEMAYACQHLRPRRARTLKQGRGGGVDAPNHIISSSDLADRAAISRHARKLAREAFKAQWLARQIARSPRPRQPPRTHPVRGAGRQVSPGSQMNP